MTKVMQPYPGPTGPALHPSLVQHHLLLPPVGEGTVCCVLPVNLSHSGAEGAVLLLQQQCDCTYQSGARAALAARKELELIIYIYYLEETIVIQYITVASSTGQISTQEEPQYTISILNLENSHSAQAPEQAGLRLAEQCAQLPRHHL